MERKRERETRLLRSRLALVQHSVWLGSRAQTKGRLFLIAPCESLLTCFLPLLLAADIQECWLPEEAVLLR